jgi:hypothetical protein
MPLINSNKTKVNDEENVHKINYLHRNIVVTRIIQTVGVIIINSKHAQDMANYTCVAENIAGRRESDVAVLSVYGESDILYGSISGDITDEDDAMDENVFIFNLNTACACVDKTLVPFKN